MTAELGPNSPRLPAARRFADELRRSMREHQVGQRRLGELTGCASSAVAQWRMGRNLPRLDTAIRLAECLSNDLLAEIVREARTETCERCGAPFLNEGGAPKRYCGETCLRIAAKIRKALAPSTPLRSQLRAVKADLAATQVELVDLKASVELMCRSCEPAGYCRTTECPLRPVSPLPLAYGLKDVPLATPAGGAWGPEHRDQMLARMREVNARRWSRPGDRERQSELMLQRHAASTPEEHAAWIEKIKRSKRHNNPGHPISDRLPRGRKPAAAVPGSPADYQRHLAQQAAGA